MTAFRRRSFPFFGNALWIDFVNTVHLQRGQVVDGLVDPSDVVRWAVAAGVVEQRAGVALIADLADGALLLAEARDVRAVLHDGLSAMASGTNVPDSFDATLNGVMAEHPVHLRLSRSDGRFHTEWHNIDRSARSVLAHIARDAALFLTTADPTLVRRCANRACPALFYDISKNHTRRWCSMDLCGNRLKVAKHRAKTVPFALPSAAYAQAAG